MNSEQLYEYLTEGRHVSGGQKKLIRNAVNYAAGISRTEERAAFLSAMLKDVYVEDDRPEITVEKLTAFQGRKKDRTGMENDNARVYANVYPLR